jgi:hypothetical protein
MTRSRGKSRRGWRGLVVALVVCQAANALGQSSAASGRPALTVRYLVYDATRKGDRIGSCTVRITQEPETVRVEIDVDLTVRVLSIPVYRWSHRATETWVSSRLTTMVADTDDDGARRHVEAATDPLGVVALTVDGQKRPGEADAVPASFWNPAVLSSRTVLDVVRGEFVRPVIRRLDDETIAAPPRPRQTRHFLLTSDHELKQEMWFDASDMLVQFRAFAPDGSAVTYRLVSAD